MSKYKVLLADDDESLRININTGASDASTTGGLSTWTLKKGIILYLLTYYTPLSKLLS